MKSANSNSNCKRKLLRVLQERVVVPVGSHDGFPVNVRVVAATNRDLHRDVLDGRFREDLYYRLNVVAIHTLPLKERPEDIEVLARHFLARFAAENGMAPKQLSSAAVEQLHRYPWPGNVRELENAIERACLFSPGEAIGAEVFPALSAVEAAQEAARLEAAQIAAFGPPAAEPAEPPASVPFHRPEDGRWPTAAEIERQHIERTLEHAGYNQSETARLLGIDRHLLRRRMLAYGLDLSRSRQGRPSLRMQSPKRRRDARLCLRRE